VRTKFQTECFTLISPQPRARLDGQLDSGQAPQSTKIKAREPCRPHPMTAQRFGLSHGAIVILENACGACLAAAVLDDALREDCVSLATGAWFDPQMLEDRRIDVHDNPNVLTVELGTSGLAQGNIAHTATVHVTRFDGG